MKLGTSCKGLFVDTTQTLFMNSLDEKSSAKSALQNSRKGKHSTKLTEAEYQGILAGDKHKFPATSLKMSNSAFLAPSPYIKG